MRAIRSRPELLRVVAGGLALISLGAATHMDPVNPTCPLNPNWSTNPTMKLTVEKSGGMKHPDILCLARLPRSQFNSL